MNAVARDDQIDMRLELCRVAPFPMMARAAKLCG
jgi:hypothetical protein